MIYLGKDKLIIKIENVQHIVLECTETGELRNKYLDKSLLTIWPNLAFKKIIKIKNNVKIRKLINCYITLKLNGEKKKKKIARMT